MSEIENAELIEAMTANLQMLRVRLGLTQVKMVQMIGVGQETYLSVENGKHTMSWGMFLSLLMVFTKNKETDVMLNVVGIYTDDLNDYLKLR